MKYLGLIFFLSLCIIGCSPKSSPDAAPTEVSMKVEGVCGMCKDRIETTVYNLSGVKTVSWHQESGVMTAVIIPSKISVEAIGQALADAGHANEVASADPSGYSDLPACCKYADGVEKH